ncbi:RimK family alpha-L-glutamate ligase [Thermodesulfobacteriota bacterium]
MDNQRRIITDNETLRAQYRSLKRGDLFIGRVRMSPSEEHILLDLLDRGIILFPEAPAQQSARSKTFQALLFKEFMPPLTEPVHDIHRLMECMNLYSRNSVEKVVTKLDRANAGRGIFLWNTLEDVYTQASLGGIPFPFVIQPFIEECRDIRVIILDDYRESYWRENSHNFRNNLHCGGKSQPCTLYDSQLALCREVMTRGKFPYAHIDLMVTQSGESFLGEINLRGGIKGAQIHPDTYREKIAAIHQAAELRHSS